MENVIDIVKSTANKLIKAPNVCSVNLGPHYINFFSDVDKEKKPDYLGVYISDEHIHMLNKDYLHERIIDRYKNQFLIHDGITLVEVPMLNKFSEIGYFVANSMMEKCIDRPDGMSDKAFVRYVSLLSYKKYEDFNAGKWKHIDIRAQLLFSGIRNDYSRSRHITQSTSTILEECVDTIEIIIDYYSKELTNGEWRRRK